MYVASGHWWDITQSTFIVGLGTAEQEASSFAVQQWCRPLYGGLTCDQNTFFIQDIHAHIFLWNGRLWFKHHKNDGTELWHYIVSFMHRDFLYTIREQWGQKQTAHVIWLLILKFLLVSLQVQMTELWWQRASQVLPDTSALIQIHFFMCGVPFTTKLQTTPCILILMSTANVTNLDT